MVSVHRPTRMELAYSWLMLPVYVWQGLGVRRSNQRMLPPPNRGNYQFHGRGEPLKLLVIGDSSAAGVGVDSIDQSFAFLLPRFLNERSGRPVQLRIAGMNSATSAQIRDHVVGHVEPRDFDYVALNIGINDAKNFHRGRRFRKDFGTLLYALRARFPSAVIIWSGVLDLATVPALPSPLNRILGIRSRLIDHHGRVLCAERGVLAPEPEWRPVSSNFSSDGFHASEAGYREWADNLATFILGLEATKSAGMAPQLSPFAE
jgi:lysophospholipase L1-like esterase